MLHWVFTPHKIFRCFYHLRTVMCAYNFSQSYQNKKILCLWQILVKKLLLKPIRKYQINFYEFLQYECGPLMVPHTSFCENSKLFSKFAPQDLRSRCFIISWVIFKNSKLGATKNPLGLARTKLLLAGDYIS